MSTDSPIETRELVFENVNIIPKPDGGERLVFSVAAEDLIEFGVRLEFGKHHLGVNRPLSQGRVLQIHKALKAGRFDEIPLNMDVALYTGDEERYPIILDRTARRLTLTVAVNKADRLKAGFGAEDDGQHRGAACELFIGMARREGDESYKAKLIFNVTAEIDPSIKSRIRKYRGQDKQKKPDKQLIYAMCHRTGEWDDLNEKFGFELTLMLNDNPNSPLKDRFHTDVSRTPKGKIRRASMVKTLGYLNKRSAQISYLTLEEKKRVVLDLMRAASEVWVSSWGDTSKNLGRPYGILALCTMLRNGAGFRQTVGKDYTYENMLAALKLARRFNWDGASYTRGGKNFNECGAELDAYIAREAAKRQAS